MKVLLVIIAAALLALIAWLSSTADHPCAHIGNPVTQAECVAAQKEK